MACIGTALHRIILVVICRIVKLAARVACSEEMEKCTLFLVVKTKCNNHAKMILTEIGCGVCVCGVDSAGDQ